MILKTDLSYHLFDSQFRSSCFENKNIEDVNLMLSLESNKNINFFINNISEPICENYLNIVYNEILNYDKKYW